MLVRKTEPIEKKYVPFTLDVYFACFGYQLPNVGAGFSEKVFCNHEQLPLTLEEDAAYTYSTTDEASSFSQVIPLCCLPRKVRTAKLTSPKVTGTKASLSDRAVTVAKSAYTARGDWYLTLIGNVERDRKLNVMCDRQKWTSYIGGLCSFETRDDRVKGLRKGSRENRHETDSAIARAIFYVYNICISL